jgi:hypothetical protein
LNLRKESRDDVLRLAAQRKLLIHASERNLPTRLVGVFKLFNQPTDAKKNEIATHRNAPNAPRPINFNGSKSSTHIFRPVPDPDAVVAVDPDPVPSASTPRVISSAPVAPEEDPIVFVPPPPTPAAAELTPPVFVASLFIFSPLDFLANIRENHDVPAMIPD